MRNYLCLAGGVRAQLCRARMPLPMFSAPLYCQQRRYEEEIEIESDYTTARYCGIRAGVAIRRKSPRLRYVRRAVRAVRRACWRQRRSGDVLPGGACQMMAKICVALRHAEVACVDIPVTAVLFARAQQHARRHEAEAQAWRPRMRIMLRKRQRMLIVRLRGCRRRRLAAAP